jgi:hypothetical protein
MPSPPREEALFFPDLAPHARTSRRVCAAVATFGRKKPLGLIGGAILLVLVAMASMLARR